MQKFVKIIIALSILLLAVAGIGYYYINFVLPEEIAKSLTHAEEPGNNLIPKKIIEKTREGKKILSEKMVIVDSELDSLNLTYDDLAIIINEVDPAEVIKTLDILNSTELHSVDQVFEIGKENITVDHIDVEIFRESFKKHFDLVLIEKILYKIEENDLINSISVPVAKKTAKQILKEREKKIRKELEIINNKN